MRRSQNSATAMPSASMASRAELEPIADVLRASRAARAAEPGRGLWLDALREACNALGTANVLRAAVAGTAAQPARPVHAIGRRDARRAVRERSRQGAVRLRRHRRQLCQPVRGGLGLCDAAPRVRRGERQEGRVGPRHRRHGRDHPGDGERGPRRRRRDRDRCRRARGDRRARPRGGVTLDDGRDIRARYVAANVNPKLLYTRLLPPDALPRRFLSASGAGATAPAPSGSTSRCSALPSFTALPGRRRSPHRRHHHGARASATWTAPSRTRATHGWSRAARRRTADPLDARRLARARRASMSRACSASTSRRNCPTADPGTTIATRSPIS